MSARFLLTYCIQLHLPLSFSFCPSPVRLALFTGPGVSQQNVDAAFGKKLMFVLLQVGQGYTFFITRRANGFPPSTYCVSVLYARLLSYYGSPSLAFRLWWLHPRRST